MMSVITKRSWKIRFSFIFVFIPVFLFLSACSLRHTSPLPLNESVVHLLEIMGYHDCNILSLADYETLATQYEVSNEELESRVQELFRQNPIEIKSDRQVLAHGDFAKISYQIFDKDKLIFESPNQVVKVGITNFDYFIESSLLGKQIGKTYSFNYNNPTLSNNPLICYVTPLYIYTLSDFIPNDESIREVFGANSLEDFYSNVLIDLENEKKQECWAQIQAALIENSTFEINDEVLIAATTSVVTQEKLYSAVFGEDFEAYLFDNYGLSKAEFYDFCYDKCEDDIKLYLVIGAIAYCEDIHMDTSTFESYCLSYGLDPLSINEEDSCYIHYYYLNDCIVDQLCKLK